MPDDPALQEVLVLLLDVSREWDLLEPSPLGYGKIFIWRRFAPRHHRKIGLAALPSGSFILVLVGIEIDLPQTINNSIGMWYIVPEPRSLRLAHEL